MKKLGINTECLGGRLKSVRGRFVSCFRDGTSTLGVIRGAVYAKFHGPPQYPVLKKEKSVRGRFVSCFRDGTLTLGVVRSKGFTLIETILVMVIMAFVMAGAVYLAGTVLFATHKNQNRAIATTLTQECAELIRNVRDTSWKLNLPWDCGWSSGGVDDVFTIENKSIQMVDCGSDNLGINLALLSGVGDSDLFLHSGLGYNHDSTGDVTPFRRSLKIVELPSSEEVIFTCQTEWDTSTGVEFVSIDTKLTNWK